MQAYQSRLGPSRARLVIDRNGITQQLVSYAQMPNVCSRTKVRKLEIYNVTWVKIVKRLIQQSVSKALATDCPYKGLIGILLAWK